MARLLASKASSCLLTILAGQLPQNTAHDTGGVLPGKLGLKTSRPQHTHNSTQNRRWQQQESPKPGAVGCSKIQFGGGSRKGAPWAGPHTASRYSPWAAIGACQYPAAHGAHLGEGREKGLHAPPSPNSTSGRTSCTALGECITVWAKETPLGLLSRMAQRDAGVEKHRTRSQQGPVERVRWVSLDGCVRHRKIESLGFGCCDRPCHLVRPTPHWAVAECGWDWHVSGPTWLVQ